MFCSKCGTKLEKETMYCQSCGSLVQNKCKSPINTFLFWLSVASVIVSFIAFFKMLMYIGIVLGAISLIGAIILFRKNKRYEKIEYTLALSVVGILSNISWLIYVLHIVPTL